MGGGNWMHKGTQDLIGVMELFYILIVVVVMTVYICQNWAVQLKWVDFTELNYT